MHLKFSYIAAALLGCILSVAATPILGQDTPSKRRIFNYEADLDIAERKYAQRSEDGSDMALGAFGKRDPAGDKVLGAFGKREPATDKALGAFGKREFVPCERLPRSLDDDKALGAFGKRDPLGVIEDASCII